MTKEPIMIDEVDVAECIFYGATTDKSQNCYRLGDKYLRSCKGYKDCYYKQLKRKEQECEMLKYGLGLANSYVNKYFQALQEIKEICKLAPKKTTCDRCHTFGFPPEHELIKLILQKCEGIKDANI